MESLNDRLNRLRCERQGMARDRYRNCNCDNCNVYRRMQEQSGVGRHVIVSDDGRRAFIMEGSDM